MKLSFAFVTDIHYGFDQANKKGSHAPRLIGRFIATANRRRVDFAVNGGDRVIQTNRASDLYYAGELSKQFNALTMPLEQVDGNHDRKYLTNAENAAIFGVPEGSYFKDMKLYRAIFWNPPTRTTPDEGFKIEPSDMDWLQATLGSAITPCIVFTHVPLDNSMHDNILAMSHDSRPFLSFYPQAEDVRQILEDSGKVLLCMAGHRHRNRHREINSIHYITHQSLVQINSKNNRPRGAFSIVTIDEENITIKGYGTGQPSYVFPRISP